MILWQGSSWFAFVSKRDASFSQHFQTHPAAPPPLLVSSLNNSLCLSIHLLDQRIDIILSVAQVASFDIVLKLPRSESASWIGQLERPQEVAGLLEVRANSIDLVDQILHADDAKFAKVVFNELVVGKRNTLLIDLTISTLVDELANRLQIRITVSNVWIDDRQHFRGRLRKADEDTIVDLKESEKLKDLAWLWGYFVDTGLGQTACREADAGVTYPLIRITKTNFGSAST
jgi:hypothetical protein